MNHLSNSRWTYCGKVSLSLLLEVLFFSMKMNGTACMWICIYVFMYANMYVSIPFGILWKETKTKSKCKNDFRISCTTNSFFFTHDLRWSKSKTLPQQETNWASIHKIYTIQHQFLHCWHIVQVLPWVPRNMTVIRQSTMKLCKSKISFLSSWVEECVCKQCQTHRVLSKYVTIQILNKIFNSILK